MNYEKRLKELNLSIPNIPPPPGNFIPAIRVGNLVYCSGQGAYKDGAQLYYGRVGDEVTVEQAYEAAAMAALNCLAEVCSVTGSINKIERIIQVRGFINSADSFHDQPAVMNGTSDRLVEIFGEAGRHTRCALGTNNLPENIPVEVEMIVEVQG